MSGSTLDYSKWDKIAGEASTDEEEGNDISPMDPTFATRHVADKLQKDGLYAMRSSKPNVIRHRAKEDKQAKKAQFSPKVKKSRKIEKSKARKGSVKAAPGRRKQWHEIRGLVDTRWANITVSSSEEVEDVGEFGMIDPAQASKMLLETGRRELPKETRWGEDDYKNSARGKETDDSKNTDCGRDPVMLQYESLRKRMESLDISTPLSSFDLKTLNFPFVTSYFAERNECFTAERLITPLCYAVQRQSAELVKFLLDNGASQSYAEDLNATKDTEGWYALHWASRMGNLKVMKTLLENGGKEVINRESSLGITAVSIAMQNSNMQCVQLLIDAKADLNIGTVTPLTVFMVKMTTTEKAGGKSEIDLKTFKMLLKAGAKVDIVLDKMPLGFKTKTNLRSQLLKASEGFANRAKFLRILEGEKTSGCE